MNWKERVVESLVEAKRVGKGHQFSKQKTKSGMKLKGFHDPRAMQAKKAAAETKSWKDPEGVAGRGVRRTITARSAPRKYHGKGWLRRGN
jgi:hypothetical protein